MVLVVETLVGITHNLQILHQCVNLFVQVLYVTTVLGVTHGLVLAPIDFSLFLSLHPLLLLTESLIACLDFRNFQINLIIFPLLHNRFFFDHLQLVIHFIQSRLLALRMLSQKATALWKRRLLLLELLNSRWLMRKRLLQRLTVLLGLVELVRVLLLLLLRVRVLSRESI